MSSVSIAVVDSGLLRVLAAGAAGAVSAVACLLKKCVILCVLSIASWAFVRLDFPGIGRGWEGAGWLERVPSSSMLLAGLGGALSGWSGSTGSRSAKGFEQSSIAMGVG